MRLRDKVAIVTGGSTGIGQAIALGFAKEGADLVVLSRHLADCQRVAKEIEMLGRRALAIKTDVSITSEITKMVQETMDYFGKIDILVNNAAIYPANPFLEITEQEVDAVFAVNLKGYFMCAQAVAREMVNQGSGRIINVTSSQAIMGHPLMAHYSAAKGGVISLTRALAAELTPLGVNVNCISPGLTVTERMTQLFSNEWLEAFRRQVPGKRLGVPQDMVGIAVVLASDEGNYITGETISIDGGVANIIYAKLGDQWEQPIAKK